MSKTSFNFKLVVDGCRLLACSQSMLTKRVVIIVNVLCAPFISFLRRTLIEKN